MIPFVASPLPRARAARWLIASVLAPVVLAACSPTYDWREIRNADDGYVSMMPARPARMTRPIDLDGLKVSMTMQGAQVEDLTFTIGEVVLPDAEAETRERAVSAMRTAMVRNIGASEAQAQEVAVPVVDSTGRVVSAAPGWRVEASGRAYERPAVLIAIFTSRGDRAWQAVVLGPEPDRGQAQQFFEGFRLVE